MSFKKAQKTKARLRLALCGLAGAGKSFSALSIADAIGKMMRAAGHGTGRIAVIDSERGSASLYADRFDFDVCELDTFSPLAYTERIKDAEGAGYDIIIVDSLSHAWSGKDGALDQKDQAADRGGNSWTAWRAVTPKHNALVDAMLGSKAHVIATMRTKMEYAQEVENGKAVIKKVGLAAIQREGMDYEFTLVGDLDLTHAMKISKSRCDGFIDIGDQFEKPGENFAKKVYGWLTNGADPVARPVPVPADPVAAAAVGATVAAALSSAFAAFIKAMDDAASTVELDTVAGGPGKPTKGTPEHATATDAYFRNRERLTKAATGVAA